MLIQERPFYGTVGRGIIFPKNCFLKTMDNVARLLKVALFAAAVLALVQPATCEAGTSESGTWFIDELKFHISAHGQISCRDCHSETDRGSKHPDPARISRKSVDFKPEVCFKCHDENRKEIEAGIHGGKPLDNKVNYANCTACHDPHYQLALNRRQIAELVSNRATADLCSACHEKKQTLPKPSADNAACLECHASPNNLDEHLKIHNVDRLCLSCHGKLRFAADSEPGVPLINASMHISAGHRKLDCLSCHSGAAQFGHGRQPAVDCRKCHNPHDEAVIHDAHIAVACQSCHLNNVKPIRKAGTSAVSWEKLQPDTDSTGLNMSRPSADGKSCGRCHYKGNTVGAAAIIIPAKSIICMPCHSATFSVHDLTTVISLLGFTFSLYAVASVWISAAAPSNIGKNIVVSAKPSYLLRVLHAIKGLFLDGILQRRLYFQARSRWVVHGLMVWPLAIRFTWGLTALVGSLMLPHQSWVWGMLDKNNPVTAFFFDFTGLLIVIGILSAILRRKITGDRAIIEGLPAPDWAAIGLLGAVISVGFILEGARIALTGATGDARFAFMGWAISLLWKSTAGLDEIYGYIWYLHAILTGAFLVYLPFSGLFHIIIAPVTAVMNSTMEHWRAMDGDTRL